LLLARRRQRAVDFCGFLEIIHRHYRVWQVVLLRDAVTAADRQHRSIDALVTHTMAYLSSLSPQQALRKAGVLSPNCWLKATS
jgi:hypothetical protein